MGIGKYYCLHAVIIADYLLLRSIEPKATRPPKVKATIKTVSRIELVSNAGRFVSVTVGVSMDEAVGVTDSVGPSVTSAVVVTTTSGAVGVVVGFDVGDAVGLLVGSWVGLPCAYVVVGSAWSVGETGNIT